jgi:Tol biopolymer transport system component
LLYVNQHTLFVAPFDLGTQEVRGTAIPLLDDLVAGGSLLGGQYSVSRNGTLAYLRNVDAGATTFPLMQMDSAGSTTPVLAARGVYFSPRYSPDGKKIAYVMGSEVWVYDVERHVPTQLTFSKTGKSELAWAPDSKHVLFGTARELLWVRADGGGQPQRLLEQKLGVRVFSTAPDGRVAFEEATTAKGLATVRLDLSDPENPKAGKPEPFQDPQAFRVDAAFSPDGKFIAMVETDTEELFVTPFPGPGGKWKISGSGGKFPAWSRTGHQLFFLGGDDRIMVADYSIQGDTFTASIPGVWSPTPVRRLGVTRNFDVSPDGKHVVMFPAASQAAGNLHITFVLNLADELKRRFSAAAK